MDVPAATAAPTLPLPASPVAGQVTLDAATPPAPGPIPVAGSATGGNTSAAGALNPSAPAAGAPAPASNQKSDSTLSPVVAKLFNTSEANVQVSFQVLHNPDEVITVFTDKSTGKEIIQFPSQALIALAEMYDKDAGKVLDKSV
jgi:uncharacterized FlaG/YvyC family protein